jgi:hypothetical protein
VAPLPREQREEVGPVPIDWKKDVDAALAEVRNSGRHAFLDFNAAPL